MTANQKRAFSAAGIVVVILSIGCQPSETSLESSPQGAVPANEIQPAERSSPESPADTVTVQIKSWPEVQQIVAGLRGQVVVLDVWSTWCVPCTVEFPHLVKLQEAFPTELACISVATNYSGLADEPPESFREEILAFLRQQNATFTNIICSTPDETLYETIGAASVPVVLVYGRNGELKKTFTNDDQEYGEDGFTYAEHIVPLVEQLLEKTE